ncbi:MAG: aconitase family protein [Pigmentiphaga sp.]|uniref:3-isopropylmalate dehydratase large subunit n=1 Tax=Pigmentiphaga sp. TaxID=1977564 RepID=UPI0029AEBD1E|nr:aconitase family protein [Pigmentiphaga sp.]MDX3907173.1 aconitase family protein [Pigmentiphaga sp.]
MGMTLVEKMLARASGKTSVKPGDIVLPDPELVIVHDGYVESAYKQLSDIGYRRVTNPERVVFVTDHQVIYTTPAGIMQGRANRRIAAEWRVGHFYDAGQGGHGHLFPIETGLVRPGMFLFAYDMHCTNFGAIGACAMRVGPNVVSVLATGTTWTVVPHTLRILLQGTPSPGVHPRDVGFWLANQLTSGNLGVEFDYRVVEFGGSYSDRLPLAGRVALCNTLTEIGVLNILFPPMSPQGLPRDASWMESDADAQFEHTLTLDISRLAPQVALPGAPDRAVRVDDTLGIAIDHAYLGSCGSGMYEDLEAAAQVLAGHRVAPNVRLIVVPGTVETAKRMAREGLTQQFLDAGAILLPPGCGPCAGGAGGPLGPGETSISTAATNGPGRMGAKDALCYLGSPLTVAASAIAGRIADPRQAQLAPAL